jgi:phosphoribosylaminoimidazole-succinocarboxamide synthase
MSEIERGALLHEGKSKQVFNVVGDDRHVVIRYKDDATAFNGVKHSQIAHKGVINAAINWHLMGHVSKAAKVPCHLVSQLNDTEQLSVRLEIVPIEVIVRNIVAGSCTRRFGIEEGTVLPGPMVELFYKDDDLGDPPMSDVHALMFGWAEQWELEYMKAAALKVNAALQDFWSALGVDIVDFKIEFGRTPEGHLLLADEITPDGCRLWEQGTKRKLDKDVFRRDLGDLSETYQELYTRIFGQALQA